MPTVPRPTCDTCRFWQEIHAAVDREAGICRVNPPTLPGGGSVIADWPQTAPDDWCGRREPPPHPLRIRG